MSHCCFEFGPGISPSGLGRYKPPGLIPGPKSKQQCDNLYFLYCERRNPPLRKMTSASLRLWSNKIT